ncbi:MAG: META domain-containing protein [Pseudomonadota bacterium]
MKYPCQLLLGAILFAATAVPVAAESTLENIYWRATEIGGKPVDLAPEQIPHVAFHAAESRVAGFSGCNRFFAVYSQNDNELAIKVMGGARATCPELGNLEVEFLAALQVTTHLELADGTLTLFDSDAHSVAKFIGVIR